MPLWFPRQRIALFGGGVPMIPAPAAAVDNLDVNLAALDAAGKLISAWFLPLATPAQYLTLSSANVTQWAAAYGSQKVALAEPTNSPQWDATLFSGKGGVTFNGTSQFLSGTGNVANWPDGSTDCWMLAAIRQDTAGATAGSKSVLDYGDGINNREIRRASISSANRVSFRNTAGDIANGSVGDLSGAHTIGGHAVVTAGPNTALTSYFDGTADGTATAGVGALTISKAVLGASSVASPSLFFSGAIVAAAILGPTATLTDFQTLEGYMRSRLS